MDGLVRVLKALTLGLAFKKKWSSLIAWENHHKKIKIEISNTQTKYIQKISKPQKTPTAKQGLENKIIYKCIVQIIFTKYTCKMLEIFGTLYIFSSG